MRKFSVDAPELFCFQLGEDDTTYKIPVASSLPLKWVKRMQEAQKKSEAELFDVQSDMLREYMGDVVDELMIPTIGQILKAWSGASNEQGASVGESSVSSS